MQCDICDSQGMGTVVRASDFSRAVAGGFNPFQEGLARDQLDGGTLMGKTTYELWRDDSISGMKSMSDWNVCHVCMTALGKYLPAAPSLPEPKQAGSPENVETRLAAMLREELRNDVVESYADEAGTTIASEVVRALGKERAQRIGANVLKRDALARVYAFMNQGSPSSEPIGKTIARELADIHIPKWWQFWRS